MYTETSVIIFKSMEIPTFLKFELITWNCGGYIGQVMVEKYRYTPNRQDSLGKIQIQLIYKGSALLTLSFEDYLSKS